MHDLPIIMNYPLCADAGLSQIDPLQDQVWELSLLAGEPPALDLHTTYGLRCLSMRLFPSFTQNGEELTDPRSFAEFPRLIQRFPNYARLACRPFTSIDVELEYWVPSSTLICGRVKLTNLGTVPLSLRMNWNAILVPGHRGFPMDTVEMGVNTVMQGYCEHLAPVFFITGGPEVTTRTYPSLGFSFALPENASRRLSWGLAALDTAENSFVQARHGTSLNWETELIKTELDEKHKAVEFHSDENDWGIWLQETQIRARQFLVNGLNGEQTLHLVDKRDPDVRLLDEKLLSRNSALNGETNLYQIWLASRLLMPANPKLIKELLRTTLEKQQADGALPFTVSPGGSVSMVKAPPLLASLVTDISDWLHEETWLKQIYPLLVRAFRCWFAKAGSEIPVWESPLQTGLENSPLFAAWLPTDQGVEIKTIFSPALVAMLYKEAHSLLQIGQKIENSEDSEWLNAISQRLSEALEHAYDPKTHSYRYLDAQSCRCEAVQELRSFKRNGLIQFKRNFKTRRRLLITCTSPKASRKSLQITLNGMCQGEPVNEKASLNFLYYQNGTSRYTSEHLFTSLESVEITGLQEDALLSLKLAGTELDDLSLFLPLWAGMVTPERAKDLVEGGLLPHYLSPYGLTSFRMENTATEKNSISTLWNTFLIEGLLRYGQREVAADVTKRLFTAIFSEWRQSGRTISSLRASDGRGSGDHGSLESLPLLWPLLQLMGVEFLDNQELILHGFNDLFAPFTVQYERVMLTLSQHSTVIQTVNGSRTEIDKAGRYKILLP